MLGFRVWDSEEKRFINSDSFVMSDIGMLAKLVSPGGVYCEPRYIPMQSTGLKDWQDKPIFEGDMLFIYIDSPVCNHYYLVQSTKDFLLMLGLIGQRINKISNDGNIYSNPELLERLK